METLLAFAPFIVYVVIERIASIMPGLVSAAVVSVVLLLRDLVSPSRTVKILDIGTVILFGGLAAYARYTAAAWSIVAVRLRVDAGLLLIVVASIIVRRPFTLQYARERVPRELWASRVCPHQLRHPRRVGGRICRDDRRGPGHALRTDAAAMGRHCRNHSGALRCIQLYRLVSKTKSGESPDDGFLNPASANRHINYRRITGNQNEKSCDHKFSADAHRHRIDRNFDQALSSGA